MKITADDLSRSYRGMSDEELLVIDQEELTDMARSCLTKEMERRSLTHLDPAAPPAPVEVDDQTTTPTPGSPPGSSASSMKSTPCFPRSKPPASRTKWRPTPARSSGPARPPMRPSASWFPPIRPSPPVTPSKSCARAEEIAAREHVEPSPVVVAAVYEDGVFKPHDPVSWEDGTEVDVRLAN